MYHAYVAFMRVHFSISAMATIRPGGFVNTTPSGRIYLGRSSSGARLPLTRSLHKEHWVYSVPVLARHAPLIAPVLTYLYLAIPAAPALEWHDPSPHKQLFIETAPGVKLEVLDWVERVIPYCCLQGMAILHTFSMTSHLDSPPAFTSAETGLP